MSIIEVSCELAYRLDAPSSFLFNIAPARTEHQQVLSESLTIGPDGEGRHEDGRFEDVGAEGNRLLRLQADPGTLSLSYRAVVRLSPQPADPPAMDETDFARLPGEVLAYLNPSRYCESDRLASFALRQFGDLSSGFARVAAVCDWTHDYLSYVAGTTDSRTGACDVLVQRTGVCRDYAHLAITLCRALCIPARYVSGYSVGLQPPDFHGFFEVYLNDAWYLFDATRMAPVSGLVRIGTGRDAADASFATIIGAAALTQMTVAARELTDEIPERAADDEAAVSTV